MSFVSTIIGTAERVPLPDLIIRAAIQRLCSRTATRLASGSAESDAAFADEMAARAIAEYTDEANVQHYEVPAAFFALVLGPNRKYSSCFYKEPASTLQEAEEEALRQTIEHADLADGQAILEHGCGWGSLALAMARRFPNAEITAVSNSQSQRDYIEQVAASRGLQNIRVVTADINLFDPDRGSNRGPSVCHREVFPVDPASRRIDNSSRLASVSRTGRRFSRSRRRASIRRGSSVAPEVSNDRVV